MLLLLIGCGGTPDTPDVPKEEWEASHPEMLDLTTLLNAAEVGEALGITVGEGLLHEHDTELVFTTADYGTVVRLIVEEPTVSACEHLDAVIAQNFSPEALTEAPNLGEKAYWCAESGELMVANGGYVVSVNVTSTSIPAEPRLIAARSLASKVLERLK